MEFGELDSYEFRGLCRLILRRTPETRFRYIIGATGVGRQMLRDSPSEPLSPVNMVWIDNDESTRAWMLCNRVQDDPLDLMVYCYRYADDERPVTPEYYWQAYLGEDEVKRRESEDLQTTGQLHYRQNPILESGSDDDQSDGADNNQPGGGASKRQDQGDGKIAMTQASGNVDSHDPTEKVRIAHAETRVDNPAKSGTSRVELNNKTLPSLNLEAARRWLFSPRPNRKGRKRSASMDLAKIDLRDPKRFCLEIGADTYSTQMDWPAPGAHAGSVQTDHCSVLAPVRDPAPFAGRKGRVPADIENDQAIKSKRQRWDSGPDSHTLKTDLEVPGLYAVCA